MTLEKSAEVYLVRANNAGKDTNGISDAEVTGHVRIPSLNPETLYS